MKDEVSEENELLESCDDKIKARIEYFKATSKLLLKLIDLKDKEISKLKEEIEKHKTEIDRLNKIIGGGHYA